MQRRTFLAVASSSLTLKAAPDAKDINGRWDITVQDDNQKRAWWLEIKGAQTAAPSGSFVGAPGGNCDPVTDLAIKDGEARWSFSRPARGNSKAWKNSYKALVRDGKLVGTVEVEGEKSVQWTGVRAPQFHKSDISLMKSGQPIELFNRRDVSGWRALRDNAPMLWKVENGVLKNSAGTTDIVSERKFMDFFMHVEYRVGEHSNSGIGLRGRYEVQILEDFGKPANTHGNGALYSRILPTSNASKRAGEWQTLDISLAGNTVSVVLNKIKIIDNKEIDGLTAIAIDPNEAEPGPIVLQGDHGPVEFRRISLTPLLRN
ncbi:MAG: DUF1080 domain-containing protein [Bryobacteraceae bacterium]|nr:DUF1080 domain-containing protein [Bryobacteraceae bacterium]